MEDQTTIIVAGVLVGVIGGIIAGGFTFAFLFHIHELDHRQRKYTDKQVDILREEMKAEKKVRE